MNRRPKASGPLRGEWLEGERQRYGETRGSSPIHFPYHLYTSHHLPEGPRFTGDDEVRGVDDTGGGPSVDIIHVNSVLVSLGTKVHLRLEERDSKLIISLKA